MNAQADSTARNKHQDQVRQRTLEDERRHQIDETRQWISQHALSALRVAWGP